MIDASIRLRRAIHLQDALLVRRIVTNNPHLLRNPDFAQKSNTSLHLAALVGSVEIAAFLLQASHERSEVARNVDHDTPLMLAARHGHVDVGRALVAACPRSIPLVNRQGLTALAVASQNPASTALLPALLGDASHPASPHVRDQDGNMALHHASASGSLKALRILLWAGANPLAKNNTDWTPLAYSQTVAAEVYFKNLMAEYERQRLESLQAEEELGRQRAAGMRLVNQAEEEQPRTPVDEDDMSGTALDPRWSPAQSRWP